MSRGRKTAFIVHALAPGEILFADGSAVFQMVLQDSVGVILYDRARRVAAAAMLPVAAASDRTGPDLGARLARTTVLLLARLLSTGSRTDNLELFALGGRPEPGGGPAGAGPLARRSAQELRAVRIALACTLPAAPAALRVEFDVALGRIVLEEDGCREKP